MKKIYIVLFLLCLFAVFFASEITTFFGWGDPQNSRTFDVNPLKVLHGKTWEIDIEKNDKSNGYLYANGIFVLISRSDEEDKETYTAIDSKNGKILWQKKNYILGWSTVITEGKIYIGTMEGEIYVLDLFTGRELKRAVFKNMERIGLSYIDSKYIYISWSYEMSFKKEDTAIYRVDRETMQIDKTLNSNSQCNLSDLLVKNNIFYLLTYDENDKDKIFVIDSEKFEIIDTIDPVYDRTSISILTDNMLTWYSPAEDFGESFFKIDLINKKVKIYPIKGYLPSINSFLVYKDFIITFHFEYIYCFDTTKNMEVKWQYKDKFNSFEYDVSIAGGVLFVAGSTHNIYAFEIETGKMLWNYETSIADPNYYGISIIPIDNALLAITDAGIVFKLE
jgi:outer membrane protein assembly factor BamB